MNLTSFLIGLVIGIAGTYGVMIWLRYSELKGKGNLSSKKEELIGGSLPLTKTLAKPQEVTDEAQ